MNGAAANDKVIPWLKEQVLILLPEAEKLFGPRDQTWTFHEITFVANGPNTYLWEPLKTIDIQLSENSRNFPNQALYQAAHEVVHLLSPTSRGNAPMLEEGAATYFSIEAPTFPSALYREQARAYIQANEGAKNYRDALAVFNELLAIDGEAILKLRNVEPRFSKFTPELIQKLIPSVSDDLASRLCERRQMR